MLKFDGTKSTVKHEQMALARVTCVRGTGPKAGIPFIDDYISTKDHVSNKKTTVTQWNRFLTTVCQGRSENFSDLRNFFLERKNIGAQNLKNL